MKKILTGLIGFIAMWIIIVSACNNSGRNPNPYTSPSTSTAVSQKEMVVEMREQTKQLTRIADALSEDSTKAAKWRIRLHPDAR